MAPHLMNEINFWLIQLGDGRREDMRRGRESYYAPLAILPFQKNEISHSP